MENPRREGKKLIKDIRNLFRLKQEQNDTAIKGKRNLFRLNTKITGIGEIILRNTKNLFEYEKEKENYYKPTGVNNFWSSNYIDYKSNSDENRILSVGENLDKIRQYSRGIINDLKQSDTWKNQFTITANFISSKDDHDHYHVQTFRK